MSLEMWDQVTKLRDGDSLNAETLNTPIGQLSDRTEYLYSRMKELLDGDTMSSVILTDVPVSNDAVAGNVVFLDRQADESFFARAKASMSLHDDFTAADSAFTVGILISRSSKTGNVLAYGRMNLNPDGSAIRIADIIESGEEFRPGRYYLSAKEAGKLTANPTGPLVYVCSIAGDVNEVGDFSSGTAIVNPQFLDIGTSHIHRTAVLTARPQGELSSDGKHVLGYGTTSPGPLHLLFGGVWTGPTLGLSYKFKVEYDGSSPTGLKLMWAEGFELSGDNYPNSQVVNAFGEGINISNGIIATLTKNGSVSYLGGSQRTWDTMLFPVAARGWVDHNEDDGDDGDGALYDYVLGMDPQVSNYWPPVPPKSAALIVNGVEVDNKALFPDTPTVSFAADTLHWYEDGVDRKPWPEAYVNRDSYIDPALDKTMVMHWVRGFQGSTGPVTSIQPKAGSPIKIYGYGTDNAANVGDLEIDASFDFDLEDGGLPGFVVPKKGSGGKLVGGPVVEKVVAGAGINLITKEGCPEGQGTVIVALDNGAYRSHFDDLALENAEQAKIGMFPYIRLKGYTTSIISPSAFTATMRIPTNLPSGEYKLHLQASVFGEVGFSGASKQTACVKLSYNILPDYDAQTGMGYANLKTGLLRPDNERTILIPFGHESDGGIVYNGFDPVLVMTNDDNVEDKDDVVEKVLGDVIPSAREFALQTVIPELRPGYLVGIRISRAVAQGVDISPYTSPIGFINMAWSLTSAASQQSGVDGAIATPGIFNGLTVKTNTISTIREAVDTMVEMGGGSVIQ